jgi:hypothetical protein
MSDPTRPATTQPPVRVVFRPYDHAAVQKLLRAVRRDFGSPGERYRFISPADSHEANAWCLDFHFSNPHDAIIFALRYQGH